MSTKMEDKKKTDSKKRIAPAEDREKALSDAIAAIEKAYGKGSIMKLDGKVASFSEGALSTGCLSLDIALGIGGLPRGRIVEIYGPESSGKTTVALHVVAEAQKNGGMAAFVDAEHALDPEYARNLGVDLSNLWVSQPDNGEQGLEIVDQLVHTGAFDVIVVDSVAALTPRAEIEGNMGDSHMGAQARMMSQALRKLTGVTAKSKTCIIFINQLREKVGVFFGSPETTPGGKALKFYSSVRLDVRKGEAVKDANEAVGIHMKVKVVKNKVAPPFKIAEMDIIFGKGISKEASLIEIGLEYDVLQKSGSWISFNNDKIGQGRENARQYLLQHPEVYSEIEALVKSKAFKIKEEV